MTLKWQVTSFSRKIRQKWQSIEEQRIDREYEVALVPLDDVCLSGFESITQTCLLVVRTWIEKSVFIGNISLIYRISDGSERILNTDYQIGGISEKYWENHRNISNILVWNR